MAVREALAMLLESEGYAVVKAVDGEEALAKYHERHPDLVLLDVMMPRKNGYAVCEAIRAQDRQVPILFLTAKDSDADELRGLMLGADDYMSKTSSDPVKLARIANALERRGGQEASGDFTFADHKVDTVGVRLVAADGAETPLTVREVEILRYLSAHPGELLSRDFLLTRFWGVNFEGEDISLSVAISRLRGKLGKDGAHIETVYGGGYRFTP